jgi:putative MATE family efflux protein
MAAQTRRLLEAPIVPTLLRLAAPNITVMVVLAAVSTFDAFLVGWLGPEALAGVSLVFPLMMLMTTMSAGGMGGGVASAIARALGSGRREDANALVVHALVIALVMAALFTGGALVGGPPLYRAMGGEGGVLQAAITYSNVVFGGALTVWLLNTLASIVRGTGNMLLPAMVVIGGELLHLALAPALVFGWGPFPALGIAGAGLATVTSFSLRSLILLGYLLSGRSLVQLTWRGLCLQRSLFRDILRVGAPGALNTVLTNLNIAMLTGFVGTFGTFALAGYGMGARLEYLQIPLVFGLGAALVTMVGTNVGAGQLARARRIAWTGAALAAGLTASMGCLGALFPHAWIGVFSAQPEVLATGSMYLHIVGPTYGFFGLGLALYFASQGMGRVLWPLLAAGVRLGIAVGGGWLALHQFGGSLPALFMAIAVALVVYGITVGVACTAGVWRQTGRSLQAVPHLAIER